MQGKDTPFVKYGAQGPDLRALFYSDPEASLRVPITMKAGYGPLPAGSFRHSSVCQEQDGRRNNYDVPVAHQRPADGQQRLGRARQFAELHFLEHLVELREDEHEDEGNDSPRDGDHHRGNSQAAGDHTPLFGHIVVGVWHTSNPEP